MRSVDRATQYAARRWPDLALRLLARAQAAASSPNIGHRLRNLERTMVFLRCWRRWNGAAFRSNGRCFSGLSGEFAQRAAELEAEIQESPGEPLNPGSPRQIGDILFAKARAAWRRQDQDRTMGDRARSVSKIGRQGQVSPQNHTRLAAGVENALALYGCASGIRQSRHSSCTIRATRLAATTHGRCLVRPKLQNIRSHRRGPPSSGAPHRHDEA